MSLCVQLYVTCTVPSPDGKFQNELSRFDPRRAYCTALHTNITHHKSKDSSNRTNQHTLHPIFPQSNTNTDTPTSVAAIMATEKRKAEEDLPTETMNEPPPSQRIKLEENDTTTMTVVEPCTDAVNVGDEMIEASHLQDNGTALEGKDEAGNIDNGDCDGETLDNPKEMIATMSTDDVAVKEAGNDVAGDEDEDETKPIEEGSADENADNADPEAIEKAANIEVEPNEAASDAMSMNVNKENSANIEVGNGEEAASLRKEELLPDEDKGNDGGGDDLGEKEGEKDKGNDGVGDDLGEKEGEKDNSAEGSKSEETSKVVVENSLNDNDFVEETELVSRQFVGRIIGKSGEMIRDLQARK